MGTDICSGRDLPHWGAKGSKQGSGALDAAAGYDMLTESMTGPRATLCSGRPGPAGEARLPLLTTTLVPGKPETQARCKNERLQ